MYGRSERRDSSRGSLGHHEDITELFSMLESTDARVVDEIKALIFENLSSSKEIWLLHGLIDYYMMSQSLRCLDILVRVREPHDKHLFDKLMECMKMETTRYQSLLLLSHLVHRQPSWLYKIAQHRTLSTLLNLLKTETNAPSLMCALLTIVSLLPMIPSLVGPFLSDMFEIFSRLAAWNTRKPTGISEIYVLHLQVGVYALFHRLYAMYPCNFLAYLRSYYGGRDYSEEHFRVFTVTIKPMLERVRLHPLLVTASKETELTPKRWKKMEAHDILVECAKISLDAIEGTQEDIALSWRSRSTGYGTVLSGPSQTLSQDSMQFVSYSSQSSTLSMTLESGSLVNEISNTNQDSIWTPSQTCGLSTPPSNIHLNPPFEISDTVKSEAAVKIPLTATTMSNELSTLLDVAEEAKPEALNDELENELMAVEISLFKCEDSQSSSKDIVISSIESLSSNNRTAAMSEETFNIEAEQVNQDSNIERKFSADSDIGLTIIVEAIEAKEEDIADKEVSDLTHLPEAAIETPSEEVRYSTPFCCTTQNLTDEPCSMSKGNDSLQKEEEEEAEEELDINARERESEIKMKTFVRTMNRYRYFSHCGPVSEVVMETSPKRPLSCRSLSCPNISVKRIKECSEKNIVGDDIIDFPEILKSSVLAVNNQESSMSNTFLLSSTLQSDIASVQSLNTAVTSYDHLFPLALAPHPISAKICGTDNERHSSLADSYSCYHGVDNQCYSCLSPAELLDRHLQLGSEIYLSQLNSIPLTCTKGTDWTHFGGQPPADEVAILRNQILMLHTQLLFERHRREVHAERNRRLLGKAKRTRMQEEYTAALKDQVSLLEGENQELKSQLAKQSMLFQQLSQDNECSETDLQKQIRKTNQENNNLKFSNKKLQGLLVLQKQENDKLREEFKESQSQLLDIRLELELSSREIARCQKLEKDMSWISKELVLMQELNSHYKEKIDLMKEQPHFPDFEVDLVKDAARAEVESLKQSLEAKTTHLDIAKSKIAEIELHLSNVNQKFTEQRQAMEIIKSLHKDEIHAREERLSELRKICQQKEAHILELYHKQETLSQEIGKEKESIDILSRYASDALLGYDCIVERFLTAKFKTKIKDLNVVCCYSPTEDSDENKKDRFYRQLQDVLNSVKKGDISLVLGDSNPKVCTDSNHLAGVLGPCGIGCSNGIGDVAMENVFYNGATCSTESANLRNQQKLYPELYASTSTQAAITTKEDRDFESAVQKPDMCIGETVTSREMFSQIHTDVNEST